MLITAIAEKGAILCFAALLLAAAWEDIRRFLIPNRLPLAMALLYPIYVMASPDAVNWTGALLGALAVFAVGFLLFAMRYAGGGDIKLLTASALWAGPALLPSLIIVTALAGGIMALILSANHFFFSGSPAKLTTGAGDLGATAPARSFRDIKLPYAVAITVGGMYVALALLSGKVVP